MKYAAILVAALALVPVNSAFAHDHMDMNMDMSETSAKPAISAGVGVVDAVDKAKGTVTLSHEPIVSLGWPAMTMDFSVEDKKLFSKLSAGKKVQFQFVKQHNHYVVTAVK
jgi:Cu(I)/Ag(I) efflux system periplasmic protein CusF